MQTCKRVHYWGRVQGVGFRMATKRVAGQHAVTGYVRNLADGQVEIVVAGQDAEIGRFLEVVAARMASFIQGHRIMDACEESSSYTNFEIQA